MLFAGQKRRCSPIPESLDPRQKRPRPCSPPPEPASTNSPTSTSPGTYSPTSTPTRVGRHASVLRAGTPRHLSRSPFTTHSSAGLSPSVKVATKHGMISVSATARLPTRSSIQAAISRLEGEDSLQDDVQMLVDCADDEVLLWIVSLTGPIQS